MFETLRKYLGESISRSLLMPMMVIGPVLVLGAAWFSGAQQIRIMERDAEGNAQTVMSAIALGIESMDEKVEAQHFVSGLAAEWHIKNIVIVQAQDQLIIASSSIQDIGKELSELQDAEIKRALSATLREQNHEWHGGFDGSDYRAVMVTTHQFADSQRTVAPGMIAICVVLDSSEQLARIRRQTFVFGATLIATWGLMLGVFKVQLDKMVLRPAARIQECLAQQKSGAGRRVVDAGCGGELGMLATTLNESFEALEESEQRYRRLFTSMTQGVVVQDGTGAIIDCNPSAESILGLTRDMMLGLDSRDPRWHCVRPDGTAFPADEHPAMVALRTGQPCLRVVMGVGVGDEVRWIRINATPTGDSSTLPLVFTTFDDITAEREAEAAIRLLAAQVEQAPFCIIRTGTDRRVAWVNSAFTKLTGYSPEEAIGVKPGGLLQGPDTNRDMVAKMRRHIDAVETVSVEILNYAKDRSPYWIELTIAPLFDAGGKHTGFVGFARDITDRVSAEKSLRDATQRLSLLNDELEQRVEKRTEEVSRQAAALENSIEAVAMYRAGNCIYRNDAHQRLFGTAGDTADWHSLIRIGGRVAKEAESNGESRMVEAQAIGADGSLVDLDISIMQLPDDVEVLVARDLTQRKAAEREVSQAKLFLETVLNSFPIAVFWKDAESRYQGCNSEFARWAGMDPQELVGLSDSDLPWGPTMAATYQSDDRLVLESGRPKLGVIEPIIDQTGSTSWLETNKVPLRDGNGIITGVVGSFQNITERVSAQRALEEREARYRALMDGAGDAILLAQLDGRLVDGNQKAEILLGCTRQELISMHISEIHPPDDIQMVREHFERIVRDGIALAENIPLRRRDGSIVYTDVMGTVLKVGDTQLVQGIFHDATSRRETEARLRDLSETLELSLESGGIGCWTYDVSAQTLNWDRRMFELYGKSPEDFTGKYEEWSNSLAPEDREEAERTLAKAVAAGEKFITRFSILTPAGTRRNIQAKSIFLRDESGLVSRVIGINYDITDLIERELALEKLNTQLAEATRQKDEFLANMSHELRTPLNAILGMSEALGMGIYGELTTRQLDSLKRVEDSGRHLLSLINDILDLAKIEAGRVVLEPETVGVPDLVSSVTRLLEENAKAKEITLTFEVDPRALAIEADPRRLRQILLNLLSNALKFTDRGGSVRLVTRLDEPNSQLLFEVRDTGEGIPPEKIVQLFRPFTQLESTLTKRHGGTGLGLSIVKRLAELHGGGVTVASTLGEGSTFSVRLPWTPPKTSSSAVKIGYPLSDSPLDSATVYRILLVEDNEGNIHVLRDFLESAGYMIEVATNGAEALRMVERSSYALILMDVQMPEMDGLEATRRIRKIKGMEHIPIIALTSFAMPGDRERCLNAGMTDYMSKPVPLRALKASIKNNLRVKKG